MRRKSINLTFLNLVNSEASLFYLAFFLLIFFFQIGLVGS